MDRIDRVKLWYYRNLSAALLKILGRMAKRIIAEKTECFRRGVEQAMSAERIVSENTAWKS